MRFLLVFRNYSRKQQATIFLKRVLNILSKVTVDYVIEVIQDCWTMIRQDLADTAVDQFSKQLTLVIPAQGGHIEHRLN